MDMRLADWSDKLRFGIETIDAQHKQLFDLAASFEGNGDQIRVMKTLALLCNYVKEHFREEEEMLARCGYPHLEAHKRIHEEFRSMLLELLREATKMSLDEIADRVRYLINGWFYNHIMVTDLDYVPLVKTQMRLHVWAPS
jgi:hemerythrin